MPPSTTTSPSSALPQAGQRYELRVCWSALEPTAFTLDTYPLTTILSTPALLQSLTQHAKSATPQPHQEDHHDRKVSSPSDDNSALLLRVLAAADYFSHHSSLMKDPPPVLVDLILDPYLYNVLPQSLVPTVGYLVVVGVVSCSANNDQTKKQN
ncbi:hypothetical protein TrVGV298_005621 [Trichoderma virens]|nr:hypothetical protein TrVGV298_005621 [Trichoderma virens]